MKGERLTLLTAIGLYGTGLWETARYSGWSSIRWTQYPVFLPSALLALSVFNHWIRSKILGWGIFTFSFLCFMAVLGSFVVQARATQGVSWMPFMRALVLYAALSLTGLFQLRRQARRSSKGGPGQQAG